jgi:predicted O-methyltransferase YrrM
MTRRRPPLAELVAAADEAWRVMDRAPGLMTEREGRFLTFALAATPVAGATIEIGSFKGKSTVGLATIVKRFGLGRVTAIDPHTSPSITDPDLAGEASSFGTFQKTVRDAGLEAQVDARRAFSGDVGRTWVEPVSFLWIDGDHTYEGVALDFEAWLPRLMDGGIIAFHDTLNGGFAGPIRVFVERVLASDQFGPAGFCGSIGWAQLRRGDGARFAAQRSKLARRARRLLPFARDGGSFGTLELLRYKLTRARVPHDPPDQAGWLAATELG